MKVQFLGQNCFLFTYRGINMLTDPFYNMQLDKSKFDIKAQKIDYVLITHAHEDHIADVKEVIGNYPETVIIGQPEICGHFNHKNSVDLNFGGTTQIEDLQITMVPASHTSSFPNGSYGGQPAGFILKNPEQTVYFAGDTGLMADMQLFPKYFGKIDSAFLPVGGHYTMDAEQAAFAAATLLNCEKVIGCHFDTFPPISIDHKMAKKSFTNQNIDFVLPDVGQEFEI